MTNMHLIREEKSYFFSSQSLEEVGRAVDALEPDSDWDVQGMDIVYEPWGQYSATIIIERWVNA